jgi:hypothetical protein
MFINSGKFAILTDSIRRMEWSFAICTRASKLLFIPLRGRQVRLCVFFVPRSGRIIPIHLPELLADLGQQGLSGAGHGSTITRHQPPNPSLPVGIDCSGLHIQGTQGFSRNCGMPGGRSAVPIASSPVSLKLPTVCPTCSLKASSGPADRCAPSQSSLCATRMSSPTFYPSFSKHRNRQTSSSRSASCAARASLPTASATTSTASAHFRRRFEDYQWLTVIAILGFCFLMAVVLRSVLRKKARPPLQGDD